MLSKEVWASEEAKFVEKEEWKHWTKKGSLIGTYYMQKMYILLLKQEVQRTNLFETKILCQNGTGDHILTTFNVSVIKVLKRDTKHHRLRVWLRERRPDTHKGPSFRVGNLAQC